MHELYICLSLCTIYNFNMHKLYKCFNLCIIDNCNMHKLYRCFGLLINHKCHVHKLYSCISLCIINYWQIHKLLHSIHLCCIDICIQDKVWSGYSLWTYTRWLYHKLDAVSRKWLIWISLYILWFHHVQICIKYKFVLNDDSMSY